MVEHRKSLEKEIIKINTKVKCVAIYDKVEQEQNECKTSPNKSVETMILTNESIIKESTDEGHLFYCDMCNYKCKNKKTILKTHQIKA